VSIMDVLVFYKLSQLQSKPETKLNAINYHRRERLNLQIPEAVLKPSLPELIVSCFSLGCKTAFI